MKTKAGPVADDLPVKKRQKARLRNVMVQRENLARRKIEKNNAYLVANFPAESTSEQRQTGMLIAEMARKYGLVAFYQDQLGKLSGCSRPDWVRKLKLVQDHLAIAQAQFTATGSPVHCVGDRERVGAQTRPLIWESVGHLDLAGNNPRFLRFPAQDIHIEWLADVAFAARLLSYTARKAQRSPESDGAPSS